MSPSFLQLSFIFGLLKGFFLTLNLLHMFCLNVVNLNNLILTSFSLLIEPLSSPHIAEGR